MNKRKGLHYCLGLYRGGNLYDTGKGREAFNKLQDIGTI